MKKPAPYLWDQRHDIQAVMASGFGWLHSSCFWLLTIRDVGAAQSWLGKLADSNLVKSVGAVGANKPGELAAIAFSYAGLQKLGLRESADYPFPTAFRSGMGSDLRRDLLRDGERDKWQWTDQDTAADTLANVHLLFAIWWDKNAPSPPEFDVGAFDVRKVHGSPDYFRGENLYEPFGFREGISQPVIYGLKSDDAPPAKPAAAEVAMEHDQVIAAGEFILGYRNEYDELSYCPDVDGWKSIGLTASPGARFTLNGSYLAVRQIEQDVDELKKLEEKFAGGHGCPATSSIAEKMMGRRRNGVPLGWAEALTAPTDDELNAFRYRVGDPTGFTVPRGSHIRRANQRDMLSHDVESGITASKLHRLLRRGRPYRDPQDDSVGLLFIACNTDLERQFEFVQQRWLCNTRFADLDDEDDPFVGAPGRDKKFSAPALPCGESTTFSSMTTTLGGGYFFLPGLGALRFICGAFSRGSSS